jgi:hypothetical protein
MGGTGRARAQWQKESLKKGFKKNPKKKLGLQSWKFVLLQVKRTKSLFSSRTTKETSTNAGQAIFAK